MVQNNITLLSFLLSGSPSGVLHHHRMYPKNSNPKILFLTCQGAWIWAVACLLGKHLPSSISCLGFLLPSLFRLLCFWVRDCVSAGSVLDSMGRKRHYRPWIKYRHNMSMWWTPLCHQSGPLSVSWSPSKFRRCRSELVSHWTNRDLAPVRRGKSLLKWILIATTGQEHRG